MLSQFLYRIPMALLLLGGATQGAAQVAVRYPQGSERALLSLSTLGGKTLASGDMRQTFKGRNLLAYLVFRFKDGSREEETTEYSQEGHFRLIRYHLIQKGPSFPHPADLSIDVPGGMVTVTTDHDGKKKIEHHPMSLPTDLANGLLFTDTQNLEAGAQGTSLSMVLGGSNPRLVKLTLQADGEDTFTSAGFRDEAERYVGKIKLGLVVGAAAALTGKTPADIKIWETKGEPTAILRVESQFYEGGPVWRIALGCPTWR